MVVERIYLCDAYGDCIGFSRTSLWEAAANSSMAGSAFRRSNVGWLGIFLIKAPKLSGFDSKNLALGKRLPLCPDSIFS
jgi:hypothetical protein